MINKIQKYLLLNHPLLWNTKIIPMGIIIILFNIIFFILGINSFDTFIFRIPIICLISIISIIIWLTFYLKNNAFKAFYPKRVISLYMEWVLVFIIVLGNIMYSFSFIKGHESSAQYKEFNPYSLGESNGYIIRYIYFALLKSLFIISFRLTNSYYWLLSFITFSILNFFIFILFIINNSIINFAITWTLLFLFSIFILLYKIIYNKAQKKSAIAVNFILWYSFFLGLIYYAVLDSLVYNQNYTHELLEYYFINPKTFLWSYLIFVFIIIFPIMKLIKKWKSLPEE